MRPEKTNRFQRAIEGLLLVLAVFWRFLLSRALPPSGPLNRQNITHYCSQKQDVAAMEQKEYFRSQKIKLKSPIR